MSDYLAIIPILLFSVIIHEIAHGWMALRLGDPTAKAMGRLTLNPFPHIDPVGSILVPLFSVLVAGRVFIAWAKPVPVNPMNFGNVRRDDVLVSVVGPLSNLALAFLCTVGFILVGLLARLVGGMNQEVTVQVLDFLLKMFYGGISLNIVLAVFNLIPVPPLDGSHVLASLLPDNIADQYTRIGFLGIFVVLILMRVPAFGEFFSDIVGGIGAPLRAMIGLFF